MVSNHVTQKIIAPPDTSKLYRPKIKNKKSDDKNQTSLVKIANQNDQDLIIF